MTLSQISTLNFRGQNVGTHLDASRSTSGIRWRSNFSSSSVRSKVFGEKLYGYFIYLTYDVTKSPNTLKTGLSASYCYDQQARLRPVALAQLGAERRGGRIDPPPASWRAAKHAPNWRG